MMCLGVGLFGSILFGFCISWTCVFLSFARLGNFSVIIFSSSFSIPCSLFSPSGTPMIWMPDVVPQVLFFFIPFCFYCSSWVFSTTLSSELLIIFSASCTLLLIPSIVSFMSVMYSLFLTGSFFFFLRFYLFLDRGREGETHQCVVASHTPTTGDLAHNPGMYPDWELNQQPFGSQADAHSAEPHQPGL